MRGDVRFMVDDPRRRRVLRGAGAALIAAVTILLTTACVTQQSALRPGPYAEPVGPGTVAGGIH